MQSSRDDMLILRGGMAPVRARKIRYYASRFFTARMWPPPDVPIAPAPVSQSTSADGETRLPTDDELALVTPVDLAAIEPPAGPIFGGLSRHDISAGLWLDIADGAGRTCSIRPLAGTGFANGAMVACLDADAQRITVRDDLEGGTLTVTTGAVVETLRYAPDTGLLLSPVEPPPSPPSLPPSQPGAAIAK